MFFIAMGEWDGILYGEHCLESGCTTVQLQGDEEEIGRKSPIGTKPGKKHFRLTILVRWKSTTQQC